MTYSTTEALAILAINFKIDCIKVIKFAPELMKNDWKKLSTEREAVLPTQLEAMVVFTKLNLTLEEIIRFFLD